MSVANIPGAYLSAEMDDDISMIFRYKMAELMVADKPTLYRKYISYGNMGEEMMYVCVQKELEYA